MMSYVQLHHAQCMPIVEVLHQASTWWSEAAASGRYYLAGTPARNAS